MAYDAYLFFPGASPAVEGETTDETYKSEKAMELKSFSLGASNLISIGSGTGGASAGKADFTSVNVTKVTDKATLSLFTNLCSGKHFPEAKIVLRKSGADNVAGEPYIIFTFKMVFISSLNWAGGFGDEQLTEQMSFEYGSFKFEYFGQKTDGTLEKAGETMWSRIKNIASETV